MLLRDVELAELRRLIRLVQRTGIGELEVSSGGRTVRISAMSGVPVVTSVPVHGSNAKAGVPVEEETARKAGGDSKPSNAMAITSPMVGTFYRAPAPDA